MKRSIKTILLFLFILINTIVVAHEFWIAPNKFRVTANEPFSFNCYVGEDYKPQVWGKRKDRTLIAEKFHLNGRVDITSDFNNKDSVPVLMRLTENGNYLITLRSKPSYIELDGKSFEKYIEEDGMTNIIQYRKENNLQEKRSRELYQRYAKSLLMVDGVTDSTYKVNTGMLLEIIPQKNPYAIKINETLPVYFEFKGKPLKNYQVRAWCKKNDKLLVKNLYTTDDKGFANIPIAYKGEWMISLVKMELYENVSKAEYESFWGSFTFENGDE